MKKHEIGTVCDDGVGDGDDCRYSKSSFGQCTRIKGHKGFHHACGTTVCYGAWK